MADYYITQNNSTYFLSGSKIYFTEGSGSSIDKTNGTEMTKDWFYETGSCNMNMLDVVEISKQVSGSYYYVRDTMEL